MKTYVYLYLTEFLLEWDMFLTEIVETVHTHFVK